MTYGGPRGVGVSYERGTLVWHIDGNQGQNLALASRQPCFKPFERVPSSLGRGSQPCHPWRRRRWSGTPWPGTCPVDCGSGLGFMICCRAKRGHLERIHWRWLKSRPESGLDCQVLSSWDLSYRMRFAFQLSICTHLSISISFYLYQYLSLFLSIYLSIHPSIYLSICTGSGVGRRARMRVRLQEYLAHQQAPPPPGPT